MHATCSLERSDLLFGKTCARLLQQHIFLTFNMYSLSHMFYILNTGFIHLINCSSILHPNYKEDVHVFLLSTLKGLAQAKIIKKSVILFWLLNMTI